MRRLRTYCPVAVGSSMGHATVTSVGRGANRNIIPKIFQMADEKQMLHYCCRRASVSYIMHSEPACYRRPEQDLAVAVQRNQDARCQKYASVQASGLLFHHGMSIRLYKLLDRLSFYLVNDRQDVMIVSWAVCWLRRVLNSILRFRSYNHLFARRYVSLYLSICLILIHHTCARPAISK